MNAMTADEARRLVRKYGDRGPDQANEWGVIQTIRELMIQIEQYANCGSTSVMHNTLPYNAKENPEVCRRLTELGYTVAYHQYRNNVTTWNISWGGE